MKNTVYGEKLKRDADLFEHAEQATRVLEEALGKSANQVTAEWDCEEDSKGRAGVTLRISDKTEAKSTKFAPTDLEQPIQLRFRLYRLWGDLLQARNERQLEDLMGAAVRGDEMARKTDGEKIDELVTATATLIERVNSVRHEIEGLQVMFTKVALLEQQLNDLRDRADDTSRRRWSVVPPLVGAVIGGIITLVGQAVIKQFWP